MLEGIRHRHTQPMLSSMMSKQSCCVYACGACACACVPVPVACTCAIERATRSAIPVELNEPQGIGPVLCSRVQVGCHLDDMKYNFMAQQLLLGMSYPPHAMTCWHHCSCDHSQPPQLQLALAGREVPLSNHVHIVYTYSGFRKRRACNTAGCGWGMANSFASLAALTSSSLAN